jgi:ABC-type Na+ efflux pump permease subunit
MMALKAVLRKESLSLLQTFSGDSRLAGFLWLALMFSGGIVLPLLIGEYWLINPAFLVVFPLLGGVMVTQNVIDSVAGERERQTLETLLTTPVPAATLMWGKLLPTWILAASIGMGNVALGIVTVNLVSDASAWQWPATQWLWGLPLMSVLFPGLTISAGFLGSLVAQTARQATQVFTLTLAGLLIFPPVVAVLLPDPYLAPLQQAWLQLQGSSPLVAVLVTLLALDSGLLWATYGRMRRLRAA